LEARRPADAERAFAKVLQKAPNNGDAHAGLGSALLEQGQCRQAIEPLRAATRLDPADSDAWANLGYCHAWVGDTAAAVDAYQRAARLEPGDITLWVSLESLFEDSRDYANLLQMRTRLADMYDKTPASILALAEAYCLYGEFSHCEALARTVIQQSRNASAHAMLGFALQGQGKLGEAATALRSAVQLDPRDAYAWQRLVDVLNQVGARRQAAEAQRELDNLGPR
jgi:Flp pilus assembly protein TadD